MIYTCTCRDSDGSNVEFYDNTKEPSCPRCGRKPSPEDCENGKCGYSIASSWGEEDDMDIFDEALDITEKIVSEHTGEDPTKEPNINPPWK